MKTVLIAHNFEDTSISACSKELAISLSRDGFRVVFLSHKPFFDTEVSVGGENGDLIVTSWGDASRPTAFRHWLRFLRLFLKYRPNVAVASFAAVNITMIASKMLSLWRAKTFAYCHTLQRQIADDEERRDWKIFRKSIVYRFFCDKVVTNSSLAEKDLWSEFGLDSSSTKSLPYGLTDRCKKINQESQQSNKPEEIRIGFLGRLSPSKGVREMMKALELVFERRPSTKIKIIVAGSGILKDEIEKSAPSIKALGKLEYSAVDSYFQSLHYSILPSRADAFAFVVAESMMNGTPALVSTAAGVSEHITDGEDGFLMDPTPESIAQCLMRAEDEISNLPNMRRNARQTYLDKFGLDVYVERMKEILFEQ